MEYRLIGPLDVRRDGHSLPLGGLKQRAVLAVLLLAHGRVVEFGTMIDAVWNDAPPAAAISSLRSYVANLRRILSGGSSKLVTTSYGYRLDRGTDSLDIALFEQAVHLGRARLQNADPVAADDILGRALELWSGTPLEDFRDHAFAYDEAARLGETHADAVEAYFDCKIVLGQHDELASELEHQLRATPMRERLWCQLMLVLYRCHRRADALRAYRRAADLLSSELGIEPGDELRGLEREIREESPFLDWTSPKPVVQHIPTKVWQGPSLFGRESEREQIGAVLARATSGAGHIVVLVGESGVGKTAVASAAAAEASALGMRTVFSSHPAGIRKPAMWPWMQILRRLGESADPAHITELIAAVPVSVAMLVPEWLPADYPVQLPALSGIDTTFGVVDGAARCVRLLVRDQPTVLILDDLDRADRPTHDVLQLITDWVHDLPLVIVITWQDGGDRAPVRRRSFDRLLSRPDATLLRLRGIDCSATRELVEHVGGIDAGLDFAASLTERTGGNPFYAREIVRMLRADGRLDQAAYAGRIPPALVPDAVAGVIRHRMTQLPRATRSALRKAALVGAEFGSASIAGVLGLGGAAMSGVLGPALNAGLLTAVDGHPDRARFTHELIRDAVASTLSASDVSAAHAVIAKAYSDSGYGTGHEEDVAAADHAWRAGESLDAQSAVLLFDRAMESSAARSAYSEFDELSTRAVEVCRRLPDGGVVEKAGFTRAVALRGFMACAAGHYDEGGVMADQLVNRYHAGGSTATGSAGYYLRSLVRFVISDPAGALEAARFLHEEIPVDTVPGPFAFDVRAFGSAAWAHAVAGDRQEADESVQAGLEMASRRKDAYGAAVVRAASVQICAMTGDRDQAARIAPAALAEIADLGLHQLAASASLIGAWARGDVHEARRALETHTAGGTRILLPLYFAVLSDAEADADDLDAAQRALLRAEEVAASTGESIWALQLRGRASRLRKRQGRTIKG